MRDFFEKCVMWSGSALTILFTIVPESFFEQYKIFKSFSNVINIIINRLLCCFVITLIIIILVLLRYCLRKKVFIKGKNYSIEIKYGNLLKEKDCKKVIAFDECFTTKIGSNPEDVNEDSICGQYLKKYPIQGIQGLINNANLKPNKKKSRYQGKVCYESGKLIHNGEFLLLAFAKLNEKGLGELSRKEYIDALSILWEEIDKYYGQKDVCIPILGSGVTRIDGTHINQQELLDIIINSYKLSLNKIKTPCKLKIVCRKKDDFSLNKIGRTL